MLRKSLYFISILLLFNACSNHDNGARARTARNGIEILQNPAVGKWNDSKEICLIPEVIIGASVSGKKDTGLFSIYDVDVDSAGNIYICDYKANAVKIYSKDGTLSSCLSYHKKRSDKLKGPLFIRVNKKGVIVVYEDGRKEISVFTKHRKFFRSFNPNSGNIKSMELDDSSRIFLSVCNLNINRKVKSGNKTRQTIQKFDLNGKLLHQFCKPFLIKKHPKLVNPYSATFITMLHSGNLLCAFHYPYILRVFTTSGKLQKVISKDFDNDAAIEIVRVPIIPFENYMLMTRTNILSTHEMPDGKILVHLIDKDSTHIEDYQTGLIARLANMCTASSKPSISHFYDLFDEKGYFLQSFTTDSFKNGIVKFIDENGKIYIQSQDYQSNTCRLTRYRYSFRNKTSGKQSNKI